jgi:hypothetical protein
MVRPSGEMADPPELPIEPKRVPSGESTINLAANAGSLDFRIHALPAKTPSARHTPATTTQGHRLVRTGIAVSCGAIRKSSTMSLID